MGGAGSQRKGACCSSSVGTSHPLQKPVAHVSFVGETSFQLTKCIQVGKGGLAVPRWVMDALRGWGGPGPGVPVERGVLERGGSMKL